MYLKHIKNKMYIVFRIHNSIIKGQKISTIKKNGFLIVNTHFSREDIQIANKLMNTC